MNSRLERAEWAVCLGATLADMPHSYVWGGQTEHFIAAHGGRIGAVHIGSGDGVSVFEKSSLGVVKGWNLTSEPVR
jgi:hypothetical protein